MSDLYVNALPQTDLMGGQDVKDEQPEAVSGFPAALLQEFKAVGDASAATLPAPPATSPAMAAKDVSITSTPSLVIEQKSQIYLQKNDKNGRTDTIQKREANGLKSGVEENQGLPNPSQNAVDRAKNATIDKAHRVAPTLKPDDWLKQRMKAGDRAAVDGMFWGGIIGTVTGAGSGVGFALLGALAFPQLLPITLPCVLLLGTVGAIGGYLTGRSAGAAERHVGEYKMSHSSS